MIEYARLVGIKFTKDLGVGAAHFGRPVNEGVREKVLPRLLQIRVGLLRHAFEDLCEQRFIERRERLPGSPDARIFSAVAIARSISFG